jgi:hypothetical protein
MRFEGGKANKRIRTGSKIRSKVEGASEEDGKAPAPGPTRKPNQKRVERGRERANEKNCEGSPGESKTRIRLIATSHTFF